MTQNLIDHVSKHGVARSHQLDEKFGLQPGFAASLLAPKVKDGTLVMCKVERPGGRACNEYRLSAAGGGRIVVHSDLSASKRMPHPRLNKQAPADPTASAERPAPPPPTTPRIGEIEKDVPVPVRNNGGAVRAALAELQPGESRVLVGYTKQSIQYAAKVLGIRTLQREEGDGRRVWRVEQ